MSDKTMAAVMEAHYINLSNPTPDNYGQCICGEWVDGMGESWDEHLAEALAAAGYGKLEDAWDEGVETGYDHAVSPSTPSGSPIDPPNNPYRRKS